MFCSFVLSDPKLMAKEKFQAIQEFRQPSPGLSLSTSGAQSPAVNSQRDVTINYGTFPFRSSRRLASATCHAQHEQAWRGAGALTGNHGPKDTA
ncbi:MAG: hypothetical protein JO110_01260 [Acetobacteraceae bacterium]|nr:hypothetical protein [Acetobacteraceae bacterium]